MKWAVHLLTVVLLPMSLLAEPVGTLDVARAVTIATNAVAQQLPQVNLTRLKFDHAEMRSESNVKQSIVVWFFLPIPDRKWEERGMENGLFVSVKMLPDGTRVTAAESKATVVRKSESQRKDTKEKPSEASQDTLLRTDHERQTPDANERMK